MNFTRKTALAGVSALLLGLTVACGGSTDPVSAPAAVVDVPSELTETPVVGDSHTEVTEHQAPQTGTSSGATSETASELASLQIRPKGSMDDYDRKAYGTAWSDKAQGVALAGNGCSTRDDILARDMTDVVRSDKCQVESGTLYDPYGTESEPYNHFIQFKRGQTTSSAVQIDHIVALGNVHVSGGGALSPEQKLQIANDPINLLAVDGPENGRKQDKDASEWLPNNDRIHCRYAASQIRVKAKYRLSVTQAEFDTLSRLISTCSV